MLENIRDILIILILGTIISLSAFMYVRPDSLGVWLQKVDNARFYNSAPIEYE